MRERISLRLAGLSLKMPRRALVTIVLPCFLAPRIVMQVCDCLDHARGADGAQLVHQRVGDLRCQPLLHLRPAGEAFDEAGELAQSDDLAVGEVGDVRTAGEGEQVVLAEGVKLDVAQQHDLVVAFREDRLEVTAWVDVQAGHQLAVGAGDAVGGFEQPFAVGVFADGEQDLADGPLDAEDVDLGVGQVARGDIAAIFACSEAFVVWGVGPAA